MEETNFLQNIYSILVLIFTTPFYLEMFIFFAASLFMMIIFMIKKDKKVRKILFIIYLTLIILLFGYYGKFLLYLFDKIVDLIFSIVYFPNVVIYFLILIIVNINAIFSIFNTYSKIKFLSQKEVLAINIINLFSFCLTYLFFFIILETVISNDLDFFSQNSLYANSIFLMLVQASSIMFVLNAIIISLIIIYSKLVSLKNNKVKNNANENIVNDNEQLLENNNKFSENVQDNNFSQNNISFDNNVNNSMYVNYDNKDTNQQN